LSSELIHLLPDSPRGRGCRLTTRTSIILDVDSNNFHRNEFVILPRATEHAGGGGVRRARRVAGEECQSWYHRRCRWNYVLPHTSYERSYILTSRRVYVHAFVGARGRTQSRAHTHTRYHARSSVYACRYTCMYVRTRARACVCVIRARIPAVACVRVRQTMRKSWCIRGIRASLKGRG